MRACLGTLCALLVFFWTTDARSKDWPTTPISGCPEVANQYISYGMYRIRLLLRPDCTYEIEFDGKKHLGTATLRLDDGALIFPFKRLDGPEGERFELRRSSYNLNGKAMYGGKAYDSSFHPWDRK